jgi:hypothetical protein
LQAEVILNANQAEQEARNMVSVNEVNELDNGDETWIPLDTSNW